MFFNRCFLTATLRFFVSCNNSITDEQKADLAKAHNTFQSNHAIKPVDIYENKTPSKWEIDSEMIEYSC